MARGPNSILHRIGKALHTQDIEITQEQLPRRWVDLIHHLDERERALSDGQTEPEPREPRSGGSQQGRR